MRSLQPLLGMWCLSYCVVVVLELLIVFTQVRTAASTNHTFICNPGGASSLGPKSCPKGQFFDFESGQCRICTKCLSPLVAKSECGFLVCGIQVDVVCCQVYEYALYGECVRDCTYCQHSKRCKLGTTECDCPKGYSGTLCQVMDPGLPNTKPPTVPPPSTISEAPPSDSTIPTLSGVAVHIVAFSVSTMIIVLLAGSGCVCVVILSKYKRRNPNHVQIHSL